jgi:hypothetical protein
MLVTSCGPHPDRGPKKQLAFGADTMKVAVFLSLAALSTASNAQDIASCSNPSGRGYFPEIGIVSAKNSGWEDETIVDGITKLIKTGEGEYDLLFVDIRKEIISATQDGGKVFMLNKGENVVSFLVVYPGTTAETYTFLKNKSGKLEYITTLSRAGDGVLITKSTVMRGDCDYINFENL